MVHKKKIGLVGLGNVATGLAELLEANKQIIADRINCQFNITKAVVKDLTKARKGLFKDVQLTTNIQELTRDPEIEVIVELSGNVPLALAAMKDSLSHNKAFITANKALFAAHSKEVWALCQANSRSVGFEATVGAAMPIIKTLREVYSADNIMLVAGIVNGTANFVLSQMTYEDMDFTQALKLASDKGYAEPDPSLDIEGHDSAHKLTIMATLAFHRSFELKDIKTEGIVKISKLDIDYAKRFGYIIKLVAIGQLLDGRYSLSVRPYMLRSTSELAMVKGVNNGFFVRGQFLGDALILGQGAGAHTTAVAVASDMIEIIRNQNSTVTNAELDFNRLAYKFDAMEIVPDEELVHEHYLRFRVKDELGVLSKVSAIFAEFKVSIHQVIQFPPSSNQTSAVDLVIITHKTANKNIDKICQAVATQKFSENQTSHIRIRNDL